MDSQQRAAFRELVHCLAVEPGVVSECAVCGESYVAMDPMHFCCCGCFLRLRRVADFRTLVLLVGLKTLAYRDATGATPAARSAAATAERCG